MRQGATALMAEESQSQPVEWLSGQVERVTFHNPDNGFCVLRVKVRGHRDLVTVLGHSATVCAGEYIQAGGTWINDRTYGPQFRATSLRTALPASRIGIERYLGSGLIKGIGPHYARRLVEVFGEDVFRVIEETPQRLKEVEGIGEVRAERIVAGWAEQKAIREIMVFLHTHGVGSSRAVRIYRTYGNEAIDLITENPYRLAQDIRGIGFVTADAIAQRLGFAKDCLPRARAGVVYALAQAMEDGHCGLPKTELAAGVEKLLAIPAALAEQAIAAEVQAGSVIADSAWGQECIFLAGLYRAEQNIAARLLRLAQGYPPWGEINTEAAIGWVEGKLGISLAETQRRAMRLALQSKIVVITGGPGVGKTTLINAILTVLRAKRLKIALCAPTGRAAKRLAECTGQEAKTIHRLLETNPKNGAFRRNEENPVP